VIAWVAVFALAAITGAFVAAHTDPFPPGVEQPGASVSPASSSEPESWTLIVTSRAVHELHVGGSCRSRWRTVGLLLVAPDGEVTGTGRALAQGRASCSFATAQVPAHAIGLDVSGHVTGATMVLMLHPAGPFTPAGSLDLGGFTNTLPVLRLPIDGTSGSGSRTVSRPDGDRGRYRSLTQAHVRCLSCGRA
jgi:hypothetical protein